MVVNRLGKRSFSLRTRKTCTAAELADLYLMHIWRIYETPETITSDRDPQFIAVLPEACQTDRNHPAAVHRRARLNERLNENYEPVYSNKASAFYQLFSKRLISFATMPEFRLCYPAP
jgi:hypothetical protein